LHFLEIKFHEHLLSKNVKTNKKPAELCASAGPELFDVA
jgi:hypothetical protein